VRELSGDSHAVTGQSLLGFQLLFACCIEWLHRRDTVVKVGQR